jgi:hypothetical protein
MRKWKRGYLYGIIPVDVEYETTFDEDMRDGAGTIGLLVAAAVLYGG